MSVDNPAAAPPRESPIVRLVRRAGFANEREFVLRVVQPALVGLIDGTVSSLAPIFAAAVTIPAFPTHLPLFIPMLHFITRDGRSRSKPFSLVNRLFLRGGWRNAFAQLNSARFVFDPGPRETYAFSTGTVSC